MNRTLCRCTSTFALIVLSQVAGSLHAKKADEAASLSELERAIVREVNFARTNPSEYAVLLTEWIQYYEDGYRLLPDRVPMRTKEGVRAVQEAVEYLQSAKALHALELSKGMSTGARDHVKNMGPSGGLGHTGKDDSSTGDRVNRYGEWRFRVGENIAYGGEDAREIVMRLIVDDGVAHRGHRANIFDRDFYVVGVACGYHDNYETMCVLTFAGEYKE